MSPLQFIASSHLVSAAVAAASGLILLAILRREGSVRADGVLNSDYLVSNLFAPTITVLMSASVMFTIATLQTLSTQPPTAQHWAVAGGAALLTVIVWTLAGRSRGRATRPVVARLEDR